SSTVLVVDRPPLFEREGPGGRVRAVAHLQREAVGARSRRDADEPPARPVRETTRRQILPDGESGGQCAADFRPRVGASPARRRQRGLDLSDAPRAEVAIAGDRDRRRGAGGIDRDGEETRPGVPALVGRGQLELVLTARGRRAREYAG